MKNWMQNMLKVILDIYVLLTQLNTLNDQLQRMDIHLRSIVEAMKKSDKSDFSYNDSNLTSSNSNVDFSLLDIKDVVKILNISTTTYYRLVRQGELVPRRKGKRHYYYHEDLSKQLNQSKRKGRI
ncbi:helix-turn-helix domain-containing protein [Sphingobacterium sp. UDSM-2020]|uniref:helix-turn-helix domain-containing protein n=1 Tax=Sphingobacterium sp. UDSM-2020 TaxID=2795738 RepID=UPI00193742EC|nr:helix-turn-helix domain-containing protein [Sphingobacterium sp. UDSM-2020]QQD14255.1 helix-turn-helix domain-containing protein [Sphingobacterium sp. UDSM-2020]